MLTGSSIRGSQARPDPKSETNSASSSHHFSSPNTLFVPSAMLAPATAQTLYQLSHGGNRLVPKLLEKHNSNRLKSQIAGLRGVPPAPVLKVHKDPSVSQFQ